MENKNRDELLKGIKDIVPTAREAAILASLDEAENKKFVPDDIGVVPAELLDEEEKAEEETVEEPKEEEAEEPVAEEVHEETVEEKPVEEEKIEETATEEPVKEEEPIEEEKAVEEVKEEPVQEEKPAEEEKTEEPVVEETPVKEEKTEDEEIDEDEEGLTEEEKEARRKLKIRGSISQAVGESETSKVPGKFEVFPEDDQFKYRLKANNGEILVVSYGYSTRDGAHAGIDTLKKNLEEGMVAYTTDKNGHSQWRLSTSNDSRIVALGETYSSLSSAQSAFASTQKFGKATKIIDLDEIPDSEKREWHFTCEDVQEKDSGSIEIYDDGGKFRARLLANNQEVLFVTAQRYSSKASLKSALDNIKEKLNKDSFHVSKDKQGRFQFIMESGSGFVYLVGETYSTKQASISAASSVLAFINKATIHDLTLKSSDVDVTLTGVKKTEE